VRFQGISGTSFLRRKTLKRGDPVGQSNESEKREEKHKKSGAWGSRKVHKTEIFDSRGGAKKHGKTLGGVRWGWRGVFLEDTWEGDFFRVETGSEPPPLLILGALCGPFWGLPAKGEREVSPGLPRGEKTGRRNQRDKTNCLTFKDSVKGGAKPERKNIPESIPG